MEISPQRKRVLRHENPFESLAQYMETLEKSTSFKEKDKQKMLDLCEIKARKIQSWIEMFQRAENCFCN